MKKTLSLFLAIFLVAISSKLAGVSDRKVQSQVIQPNQGSITGRVYARERGEDTTSLSLEIGYRYSDYAAGEKSLSLDTYKVPATFAPIRDIRFRGNYNRAVRVPTTEELFGNHSRLFENPPGGGQGGNLLALAPTSSGIISFDPSTIATTWDGKWDVSVEQDENGFSINLKDRDPATPEYFFFGRFDVAAKIADVSKEKLEIEVRSGDGVIGEMALDPTVLQPVELNSEAAKSTFNMPYTVQPGESAYGTINVNSFKRAYQSNYRYLDAPATAPKQPPEVASPPSSPGVVFYALDWRHVGRFSPEAQQSGVQRLLLGGLALADKAFVKTALPAEAKPTDSIGVVGVNAFGEKFLDAKLENTQIQPRDAATSCSFDSPQTNKYVFAGRTLCACGCFDPENIEDLEGETSGIFLFDGLKILPLAISNTTATFLIPEGTAPKEYTLQYVAGGNNVSAKFRVIDLDGEVDEKELLQGNSTLMTLRILGTPEKLPLKITNMTTGIITITGGDVQTIQTSGGANNEVKRQVNGIKVGDFDIQYALDEAPCPCLERP